MVGELKMPFLVGSQRSKSRCRCASSSSGVNWASGWEGKGTGVRREEGEEGEERRGEERSCARTNGAGSAPQARHYKHVLNARGQLRVLES